MDTGQTVLDFRKQVLAKIWNGIEPLQSDNSLVACNN